MTNPIDFIQDNSTGRYDCPVCFHTKTLSIDKSTSTTMWNCFSANCSFSGRSNSKLSADDIRKALAAIPHIANKAFSIPHWFTSVRNFKGAIDLLNKYDCWTDKAEIYYDAQLSRLVFIITENDIPVGAIGRRIDGQGDTGTKWHKYAGSKPVPFICGPITSDIILVEDCFSAIAISSHVTGVALLGTNVYDTYIPILAKAKSIRIALDPDANKVALAIIKDLSGYFPITQLIITSDFKDMTKKEISRCLSS